MLFFRQYHGVSYRVLRVYPEFDIHILYVCICLYLCIRQVHGVSYRHIEQYVLARYGNCANSRLMGALSAAARAGRLTREVCTPPPEDRSVG